jgi:hypothetical protein
MLHSPCCQVYSRCFPVLQHMSLTVSCCSLAHTAKACCNDSSALRAQASAGSFGQCSVPGVTCILLLTS